MRKVVVEIYTTIIHHEENCGGDYCCILRLSKINIVITSTIDNKMYKGLHMCLFKVKVKYMINKD